MRPRGDAYGHEVWDFHMKGEGYEVIEREDWLVDPSEVAPEVYFAQFEEWPEAERKGIAYVRGRVLDVGRGAGRVCLYLQSRKNLEVVGVDNSPLALKVAKARGVRKTRLLAFKDVDFAPRSFDMVVMNGNNFGLFANRRQAKRLLRKLHAMTTAAGRIVCSSVPPQDGRPGPPALPEME